MHRAVNNLNVFCLCQLEPRLESSSHLSSNVKLSIFLSKCIFFVSHVSGVNQCVVFMLKLMPLPQMLKQISCIPHQIPNFESHFEDFNFGRLVQKTS